MDTVGINAEVASEETRRLESMSPGLGESHAVKWEAPEEMKRELQDLEG